MEHYRLRGKILPKKEISGFYKWMTIILSYTLGATISFVVAICLGFFPGGIISLSLMVIDYAGSYNLNGVIIIGPWFLESLLFFIICFGNIIARIHKSLRS